MDSCTTCLEAFRWNLDNFATIFETASMEITKLIESNESHGAHGDGNPYQDHPYHQLPFVVPQIVLQSFLSFEEEEKMKRRETMRPNHEDSGPISSGNRTEIRTENRSETSTVNRLENRLETRIENSTEICKKHNPVHPKPKPRSRSTSMSMSKLSPISMLTPKTNAKPINLITSPESMEETNKLKCQDFLTLLMNLAGCETKVTAGKVRKSVQKLINGEVDSDEFCNEMALSLNITPRMSLRVLLRTGMPLVREALARNEIAIDGIRPPPLPKKARNTSTIRTRSVGRSKPSDETNLRSPGLPKATRKRRHTVVAGSKLERPVVSPLENIKVAVTPSRIPKVASGKNTHGFQTPQRFLRSAKKKTASR